MEGIRMRAAWIEVDLEALRKNIRYLKSKIGPTTKFMAVVKANVYGHGMCPVAQILREEGCDQFAVALVQEGVLLRENGFQEPILVLGHVFPEEYQQILAHNLSVSIDTLEQAEELNDVALQFGSRISIHLKIDTGMGRLGFLPNQSSLEQICEILKLPGLMVDGIFTHFATAPQISDTSYCWHQFHLFEEFLKELEKKEVHIPLRHASNSGAAILFPQMQLDMIRPGTALYGLYPGEELEGQAGISLTPVLSVKAKLARVKPVPSGTRVSYSSTFTTKCPSTLGVVPMGYVDGIFRSLANKGEVLLHGQRCPMVGNICMDQFVIDITHIENPKVGDEVVIIGKQGTEEITAEEIGRKAGTISIEILCDLGERMPIHYLN